MRLLGSITYDWHGERQHAVAGPACIIRLERPWVTVATPTSGTKLVAWESVRALSGWSPVAEEDR